MAKAKVEVEVTEKGAEKAKQGLEGVKGTLISTAAAVDLAQKAFTFLSSAFSNMSEKFASDAKIDAVLKSTKEAAGMTKDSLNELTASLRENTIMSGSMIKEGEHMLLTFTQIGKEVFPQATETVMNMATAFGVDAKTSAVQLGKALNDPLNGMTALKRVGVTFSADQKKIIQGFVEQGDIVSAQKVILGELNTEFGGLAKAMANTPTGKMQQFAHSIENVKNAALMMLIKGLTPILNVLQDVAHWINGANEKFKGLGTVAQYVVAPLALLTAGLVAYSAISSMTIIKTTFLAVVHNGLAIAQGIATAAQWLLNAAMTANPIGVVITLLALLVGGTVLLGTQNENTASSLKKTWEQLKTFAEWAFRILTPIGQMITLGQVLYEKFPLVRKVFDGVWESLKIGYQMLKDAFDMGMKFLGLGQTEEEKAAEKRKEAREKEKKERALDFEVESKIEETKFNKNQLRIRDTITDAEKQKKALLMEETRYNWAMKMLADKTGEDALEWQVKAKESTQKMRDMDIASGKASAAKKKKMEEEYMKLYLDNISDEEQAAMERYAWEIEKQQDALKKKEISQKIYNESEVNLYKKLSDELEKIAENRLKTDRKEVQEFKAGLEALHAQWKQMQSEVEQAQRAAQARVDSADATRKIGISMLKTKREQIDAQYQYETEKMEEAHDTGKMLDDEYLATKAQKDKQYQDDKLALELDTTNQIAGILATNFDKNTAVGKMAAAVQAGINTREGATKALAQGGIFGIPLMALVIAAGAYQIEQIMSATPPKARARGGIMQGNTYQVNEEGPEFAMNAHATARNRTLLESMNAESPGKRVVAPFTPERQVRMFVDIGGKLKFDGEDAYALISRQILIRQSESF